VVAVSDKWVPKAGGGVAIGAALGAGLLLSNGVLNPAVALAMGLGRSPALWAAALGGVAFAALFDLLSVKQEQEQDQEEEKQAEDAPERQPERTPASRPVAPAALPIKPVVYAAPSARVAAPLPRPKASSSAGSKRASATPSRSLWSSVVGMLTRQVKPQAQRQTITRPGSGD